MKIFDLLFMLSALVVVFLSGSLVVMVIRFRWDRARAAASILGVYLILYTTALLAVAHSTPRRILAPLQKECFDDWCVAAISAQPARSTICGGDSVSADWVVKIRISSEAKRIRQRARDPSALMEDQTGHRYYACDAPSRPLSDELGPGESFEVSEPFRLPTGARPAGLVVQHGAFPGAIIIGDDQSFSHPPSLLQLEILKGANE
jgi:hypothetical protein